MGLALGDRALLDDLLSLGQDELDVAGLGHEGVDLEKTKSANGTPPPMEGDIHGRGHGRCVSGPWEPG